VGEVFVQVEFDGLVHGGKGASTDIVEASGRAYLNATNKVLFARRAASNVAAAVRP
jgi:2-isopropylmalate synthase